MTTTKEKRYSVHSIFGPTIQGEATMAGVPCKFLRFSGCNMWDGRPATRESSLCPYCDTDFLSHTMMTKEEIVQGLVDLGSPSVEWIWVSGGEPLMQLDSDLMREIKEAGYYIAIETNGTRPFLDPECRDLVDHLTVSPKMPPSGIVMREADTLKILYPHPNQLITPESFRDFKAPNKYLQPVWAEDPFTKNQRPAETNANVRATIEKLYELPGWRIAYQLHKVLGLQ